ncbi:MAG: copper amine oxidase N-terminal domain-containing protein [Firmicutes bacterium]|nr:copper amine oxidase N-terminal domain-containing protein [Bacillota bacterium]
MFKRKRVLSLALAAVIAFSAVFAANFQRAEAAGGGVTVFMNGAQVSFDVQPQIISDRTMVPVSAIGKILGAGVNWIGEMQKVVVILNTKYVDLVVGSPYMTIADTGAKSVRAVKLDSPPVNVSGRVLVPLSAIAEAFGADVRWDGAAKRVDIITNGQAPAAPAAPTQAPATAAPPAPAQTAGPAVSPVFGMTPSFRIVSGNQIQTMYSNVGVMPFVMFYFDSSTQAAVSAMPTVTYAASGVSTQIFGLDVKSSDKIGEIGSWLWQQVSKNDASRPALLFCYANGTIMKLDDFSKAEAVSSAFRNWAAGSPITAPTPTPSASPAATPTPTSAPFDIRNVANYNSYLRVLNAVGVQSEADSGFSFILAAFDSSKDPSAFTDTLSNVFKAAADSQTTLRVLDVAQSNMADLLLIRNYYGNNNLTANPSIFYVSQGIIQYMFDPSGMSAAAVAEQMTEIAQNETY